MRAGTIRPAGDADLPALTDIYNHYVVNTAITFDAEPFTSEQRRGWFVDHVQGGPRVRLLVATTEEGTVQGYATTSRFRPKPGYDTTVEASIYCHPDHVGRGIGTRLYSALFESVAREDIYRIVAGVALPNDASLSLHRRFGFQHVGVFTSVGRKFGKYWDVAWFERPLIV